ncbi:MAG TPA: hypothetical protein VMT30_04560 [Candidatus Saccharimonadia bacterium]|nr:hypothetical protein [Candidatus Saccharimonadia bacterium]
MLSKPVSHFTIPSADSPATAEQFIHETREAAANGRELLRFVWPDGPGDTSGFWALFYRLAYQGHGSNSMGAPVAEHTVYGGGHNYTRQYRLHPRSYGEDVEAGSHVIICSLHSDRVGAVEVRLEYRQRDDGSFIMARLTFS